MQFLLEVVFVYTTNGDREIDSQQDAGQGPALQSGMTLSLP
jgi:hypothetical protein